MHFIHRFSNNVYIASRRHTVSRLHFAETWQFCYFGHTIVPWPFLYSRSEAWGRMGVQYFLRRELFGTLNTWYSDSFWCSPCVFHAIAWESMPHSRPPKQWKPVYYPYRRTILASWYVVYSYVMICHHSHQHNPTVVRVVSQLSYHKSFWILSTINPCFFLAKPTFC